MPGRVQSHTDACSEPQREQAAEEGGRRQADSAALSGKGTTAGEAGLVPVVAKPTLEPPRFHLPETRPRAGVPRSRFSHRRASNRTEHGNHLGRL